MSKSGFRDSPPAPSCAVNSCYRLDQLNLRMVGCKVVLRNKMISYSCFATLMRSFKSLKQAFYQHENNSISSDDLMDACLHGDVAQWLEREILINPNGRKFKSFHLHQRLYGYSLHLYIKVAVQESRVIVRSYSSGRRERS